MKKWLVVCLTAFTFSLVACSQEEVKGEGEAAQVEVNKKEKELEQQQKIEQQRAIHYAQYYNVLNEAVETLGLAPQSPVYDSETITTGVYYAELIDFDGDGFEELYVLMKNDGDLRSSYAHRNVANYVHEVWTPNQEGDTPVLGFSYEIEAMECSACDLSVTILKDGNRSFISQFRHKTSQGYVYNEETFFTKPSYSSHFEEKVFIQESDGNSIDGVTVERERFEEEMDKFSGEEQPIIISEGGFKRYGFEQMGASVVEPLLQKLSGSKAAASGEPTKQGEAQMEQEVKNFLTDVVPVNLDVLNPETYETVVFNAIVFGEVPSTIDPESYTSAYLREDVEASIKRHFGVSIDLSKASFAKPSEQMTNPLTYEAGKFYVAATDFYGDEIQRHFDEVLEVKENVYYVKMTDHEFDSMGYDDLIDFKSTPIEQMPADAEPYLKKNIKRYAVVKIIKGEPKLQYIGKKNLTEAEVKKY